MTPAAYAVGLARHAADGRLLDAWFPRTNVGEHPQSGAKILAAAGLENGSATLPEEAAEQLLGTIHGINADTIRSLLPAVAAASLVPRRLIVVAIASLEDPPVDPGDVYLRLHLLSARRIRPHGANLTGIFGLLANVAWTSAGPFAVDELEPQRVAACVRGEQLSVHGVDKFPRMVDYVVPTGVRIADADRVRLGAHLAEGTTVMHEGFVNFNAGTLGASMVEGRISAGVVIGDGTDVGGGASIMGTLSRRQRDRDHGGRALPARRQLRARHPTGRRVHAGVRAVSHRRHQGAPARRRHRARARPRRHQRHALPA